MLKTAVASDEWQVASAKLKIYAELLTQWNQKINLVSPGTVAELWTRHIEDCAQLAEYLPPKAAVLDVGSGAGLPGMILSILGFNVWMIESDQRKCVFLEEAARRCGVIPVVVNKRVENLSRDKAAGPVTITARAFAPLPELLSLTKGLSRDYVLLKGQGVEAEIEAAKKQGWQFSHRLLPSHTGSGFILIISEVQEKL